MTEQNRADGAAPLRQLAVGACVFGALVLLGALLGLVWWQFAPRAEGTALGDGQVFTGTTEDVFAGEGYFVVMTALAGLATGYAAYMVQFPLARRRLQDLRLAVLVAGFLGAVAGALLTWRVGVALDGGAHAAVGAAESGATVVTGLHLDATAFLVAWPFVFVLQYGLLDAVSIVRRDLPGVPAPAPAPPEGAAEGGVGQEDGDRAPQDGGRPPAPPARGAPVAVEHDPSGPEGTGR
ncbi:hypothetical protein ABZ234_23380 [Nocardiopsis sp. NPDC006198]|uniref:hypothetical protein n=1 Tax=Nocardiopsis sp. NPDC006198 TaxID=3154472 RepID=UPI0033AF24D7